MLKLILLSISNVRTFCLSCKLYPYQFDYVILFICFQRLTEHCAYADGEVQEECEQKQAWMLKNSNLSVFSYIGRIIIVMACHVLVADFELCSWKENMDVSKLKLLRWSVLHGSTAQLCSAAGITIWYSSGVYISIIFWLNLDWSSNDFWICKKRESGEEVNETTLKT